MTLSIIIVSFNTQEVLEKCLFSLKKGTAGTKGDWEVIVIDNASADDSVKVIKKAKAILIQNDQNLGFAKAVNQGIRKAQGEYLLLLNSDIICQKGAITKLVEFAQKSENLGLVGGQLLNPDQTPQASVFHLPTACRALKEFWLGQAGAFQKYLPQAVKPVKVEAVVGAVMLIPRPTLEKIGPLDENYFLYFEDLDYCRRLKKAQLEVWYLPQAKFIHFHGQSGKKSPLAVNQYLVKSSQIYHGKSKHFLINLIIRLGQKAAKSFS